MRVTLETETTAAITPSRRVTLHERPDRGFSRRRHHGHPDLSGSSAAVARSHSLPPLAWLFERTILRESFQLSKAGPIPIGVDPPDC